MTDAVTLSDPEIGSTIVVDGVATNYHDAGAGAPVLLVHGSGPGVSAWANWRRALSSSLRIHELIPRSQLHVFGRCGHWTQIEKGPEFVHLLRGFLPGAGR